MREQATLSRRALAALPIAAFAGAPRPAAAADDAALLDLGRRWQAIHEVHVAHWRAWQVLPEAEKDRRNADLDAECEAMSRREWLLEDRIHAIPAATLAGLAIKARIVAHEFDVEDLAVASIELEKARRKQDDCQVHAALSLALDVLKLIARAA